MVDSKYLVLNSEFFNIKCKIKDYYYNETYKLWTFVFFNSDILFIYDKNILSLDICGVE